MVCADGSLIAYMTIAVKFDSSILSAGTATRTQAARAFISLVTHAREELNYKDKSVLYYQASYKKKREVEVRPTSILYFGE